MQVAAIKFSFKDMPALAFMVAHSLKDDLPNNRWMVSDRNSHMQVVDSPHTRTHV
jgi:hypothetical protein